MRKRDEEILTFDSDRYEREGDAYLSCHRGGGVETNGDDRIRAMTLMAVVSNVAGELNADSAVENHARTLVAGLDESETNGRAFEATATSALVVARDDFVANQILRINSRNDEIQAIQRALERSQSPAERFRVLNNLCHVTEDERIQRLLQRRLRDVAEDYAERRAEGEVVKIVDGKIEIVSPRKFVLETVIENVSWSA